MMQHDDIPDRYADVLGEQPSPAVARLTTLLDAACAPAPAEQAARIDAAMARAMCEQTAAVPLYAPQRRNGALVTMRARLASTAAAVLLVTGGAVGYQQLHGVAPASAQHVLSRAAAAMRLAPGQAAHLVYSISVTPPSGSTSSAGKAAMNGLTSDVWVQADASGTPGESAQTLTAGVPNQGGGAGNEGRYIQIGQQVYAYDRAHNAILISPGARSEQPSWVVPNDALDGTSVTRELSALAQRSPSQVQLLPRQTIDGTMVDAIQVNGWTDRPGQRTTFYFDTKSYVLRGFDAVGIDPSYPMPSWQVRLESYTPMAAPAVPVGAFALNAPLDARIVAPQPDPAIVASVCHGTSMKQVLAGGAESLLAACQATAPTVTADSLVSALLAPFRHMLTVAVAAHQATARQEVVALAAQQQWLRAFVTSPGGGGNH